MCADRVVNGYLQTGMNSVSQGAGKECNTKCGKPAPEIWAADCVTLRSKVRESRSQFTGCADCQRGADRICLDGAESEAIVLRFRELQ